MNDMMKMVVHKGNVERNRWMGVESLYDKKYVNLYIGSGRFGACFDAWGLMNRPYVNWANSKGNNMANTVFMHADHWSRGNYGLDYHLPVARLTWADALPQKVACYSQQSNLYDGKLSTYITLPDTKTSISIVSYFNPYNRDIFAMEIIHTGTMPPMQLCPETNIITQYGNHFEGKITKTDIDMQGNEWWAHLSIGTANTCIGISIISEKGNVEISNAQSGPVFSFDGSDGQHLILLGVAAAKRQTELMDAIHAIRSAKEYSSNSVDAWHQRWGSAYLSIPDERYQAFWARSIYHILCSYSPDADCVCPPHGWSGNGWNFHFPQDFSYVHPALLRLGHVDIARAKVDFYRSRLDDSIRHAKRIYQAEGAMWPWEHPIGTDYALFTKSCEDVNGDEITKYNADGSLMYAAPNWCQFEIHNGAYPTRMAFETSLYVNDEEWVRTVAWPIVKESTRFYVSVLRKEDDGSWGIHVMPSMGQDEAGGVNEKNYLCALFSAKYCLKKALIMAKTVGWKSDEIEKWEGILSDGLAFQRLFSKDLGIYVTCESLIGVSEIEQKHPVQLNPLIFLPLHELEPQTVQAYQQRYDLCMRVKDNYSPGWTLGAFWLAASHMRDADTMLTEFAAMFAMDYTDEEMIQIYESSALYFSQYYTTTHGLFVQALNDALLSDFWGDIEFGAACPKSWENAAFFNFLASDGKSWCGEKKEDGTWDVMPKSHTQ